jgi:uncharacterized membrane protein
VKGSFNCACHAWIEISVLEKIYIFTYAIFFLNLTKIFLLLIFWRFCLTRCLLFHVASLQHKPKCLFKFFFFANNITNLDVTEITNETYVKDN